MVVCLDANKICIVDSINNRVVKTIEGIGICHRMQPKIIDYHQHFSCNPRNQNCFVVPSMPDRYSFMI